MKKQSVMILAVLVIGATGFVGFKFAEPKASEFEVEYKIDCSTCDVYFRNSEGKSEEIVGVGGEWNYSFKGKTGQFAYLSATNERGEPVTVTILKNGKVAESGSSSDPLVSARAGFILN